MAETIDVLLTGPLPGSTAERLDETFRVLRPFASAAEEAELANRAGRVRGIAAGAMHGRIDDAFLAKFPKLEIVSSFGVGYDHVDAKAAAERGIVVTNTPDVLNEEVADTAMGLLLSTVRQLPQVDAYLRAGRWLERHFPLTDTLRGKRMGILGLGRIGKAIAKRAEAFGLDVVYHGRSRQPGVPYLYYPTLTAMARAVDILMVITPGGAGTRHIVNAEVLDALGPKGTLINVARGSVVDEAALIEALRTGRLGNAGLDVFADEPNVPRALIEMEKVVLFPHVGSASIHTREAMGNLVVDNLVHWFGGKGPLTPVAETPWPRSVSNR